MQLVSLRIKNFKSIRDMQISNIENALILVGKNNTGKTTVMDAIQAAAGTYEITERDFNEKKQNIEIIMSLKITRDDRELFHKNGLVSQYKRYEIWERDFYNKLPSCREDILDFEFVVNQQGVVRYGDGYRKHNKYIQDILPKIYYIDTYRQFQQLQDDVLLCQEDDLLKQMRSNCCMFSSAKECNQCFSCIGLINQKRPDELNAFETARLLEYKLYQQNLSDFAERLNLNFRKNGGFEEIRYSMHGSLSQLLQVDTELYNEQQGRVQPIEHMGKGMRSLYMLSLLETYAEGDNSLPCLIMVEDPEAFLHPKLQKVSGEILYRLSKKNQVIFSTHSPNLLPNFSTRQIRQVVLDQEYYSVIREKADIDDILDDLGYTAGDLMNVDFVFIVEGKQDKSRLPLLLEKYYSEIYDDEGRLSRISIITTNSCTNIKTYANLKYMNQLYLRDQFLMIRDGDGKNPDELGRQLCRYYDERNKQDADKLPRVTRRNVLILKYYSFENYFFNPEIMTAVGVVDSPEIFYETLYEKWKEYLYRLRSGKQLTEVIGRDFESPDDMRNHMEEIRTYLRGHNLYDLFYGRYKENETELLKKYIELAPREDFKDILDAIDGFIYFESRKQEC